MTASTISSGNLVTRFQNKVKREYVREGRFGPNIGADINSIIQVNRNLKKVSIPLVAKLSGAGVSGSTALGGAEEALANYDFTMQPTYKRNGVLVDNEENEKAEFDLFSEARPALMNWAMEKKRDEIIQAMGACVSDTGYQNYGGTVGATGAGAATAANMDEWAIANADRVVYGALNSNYSAGNHTTALATLDNTADKCTLDIVTLLKRTAENADPLIRPVVVKGDEPWYVFYVGTYAFRDIQVSIQTLQSNAMPRNVSDNPLWSGGDLMLDGVIVKKVPEIDSLFIDGTAGPFGGKWGAGATGDSLATGGASSIRCSVGFFCGAQAVGFGVGRDASFALRKEDDYGHLNGVGVTMKSDIKKTYFNDKQHGMVTHFHASVADA